ncbi:MAG: hypothetical protein AABX47_09450 [Nanoarchaeota archaeon]
MESFTEAFRQAKDKVKVADYGVNRILAMSRDANVVRSALVNVRDAQERAVDAILLYERVYKRVPAYPVGHLETKLRLFSQYCIKRYKFTDETVKDIRLVNEWVRSSEGLQISLSSDNRLVISDGGFQSQSVPLAGIKSMIVKANSFIDAVGKVVQNVGSD